MVHVFKMHCSRLLFGPKEQEKENEHVHMTSTAKVACTSAVNLILLNLELSLEP